MRVLSPLLALLAMSAVAAQEPQPNIVVFLVDDLGWQDTSLPLGPAPSAWNARYRTPNLERLAKSGVRFTHAHAHCVCSPTRTSIMTGQSPARHHVTQWTLDAGRDPSGTTERLRSPAGWRSDGLQPGDVTLAALLQREGYRTIHAGKAHWGANGTAGQDPCALGFDINIGGHAAGAPGSYRGQDGFGAAKPKWAVPGFERYSGLPVHLTDATTAEALRAVEGAVTAGVPFYLYLAHYAVHTPIQPHEPFARAYRRSGLDEREASYASMVEGVDNSLGAVLAHLRLLGVAENTIVLFASDNGGLAAHARGAVPEGVPAGATNYPLRAGKGSAYEGGTRVPMVVSWAASRADHPAQQRIAIHAGAASDAPVVIEDVFATVLAWAGIDVPPDHPIDGLDLTPVLRGEAGGFASRPLLFHYPHVWSNGVRKNHPRGGYEPHSSITVDGWKAIYFYEPRRWELYHLARDLSEEHDRAAGDPARLASLAAQLVRGLTARGAEWPAQRDGGAAETIVAPPSAGDAGGETPLALARAAGRWLAAQAVPADRGVTWPVEPARSERCETNLYSGTAGIVLFFLELHAATGDPEHLALAAAGADHLAATLPADGEVSSYGLYTGIAGVGFALAEAHRSTGEAAHLAGARRCLALVRAGARANGAGVEWNDNSDIISGGAGIGCYLLDAARRFDDPEALALARRAGDRLIESARATSGGEKWQMTATSARYYPNFSHGTAGVAFFLATLARQTGVEKYLVHARRGAAELASIDAGGLVHHHDPGGEDLFYLGWCHGPAGTAALYERLAQVGAVAVGDAGVARCKAALLASGLPGRSPGYWDNAGVCCGTAGIVEFLQRTATTDEEHALCAGLLADLRLRATRDARGARWVVAEHRVRPDLRGAQTGYAQGAAGIGLVLLRCGGRSPRIVMPDSPRW